jgi:hypothetical protein
MTATDLLLFAQMRGRPGGAPPFGPAGPSAGDVGMAIGSMLAIYFVVFVIIGIPIAVGMWKTFTKAGQPGWAAIVPFYNFYVLGEISGKGGMYGLLVAIGTCIPCVNLIAVVFYILLLIDFCKAYGEGAGMAIGLWLLAPIFWPIMGFGSAEYVGAPGSGGRRSRRRRDYDDDDDDDDDRPRRKRLDYDDDEDDRPRRKDERIRRDDDDDEDEPPRRPDDRVRRKPRFDDY